MHCKKPSLVCNSILGSLSLSLSLSGTEMLFHLFPSLRFHLLSFQFFFYFTLFPFPLSSFPTAYGNTIIRHFKHCSADVKVQLYNSYCCSIYCCALISVYHKTVLDKLLVACNKVFKSLMGVPRDVSASALFVSLNVCNFAILRGKLVYRF